MTSYNNYINNNNTYSHIQDNNNNENNNENLHTLILMNNPNLAIQQHHQQLLNYARLAPPDHNNVTLYGYPQEEARDTSRARQGLSLTLSSETHGGGVTQQSDVAGAGGQVSVLGSKYLRATQELLEEVANVGENIVDNNDHLKKGKGVGDMQSADDGDNNKPDGSSTQQLSTAERHEVQMKKAKLVTMLDEAEQRYRQYSNQIQIVIESFERAAGMGSAKTYTALALKTISKQFRCLKDAIQRQIRAASKSLGEDEGGSGLSGGKIEGSRLKFIDHQIRQQRALQQLGMIQNHNAWRPQRGLPERSVSVLRAWLFEHFLHPYPKDSDKVLLAKQTGLTRSQVSNWFINARVRLWKPMIEEMYNEELKEQEKNGSDEKANTKENTSNNESTSEQANINNIVETQVKPSQLLEQHNNVVNNSSSFMSIPMSSGPNYNQPGFTLNGSFELEGISQGSPKRQRTNEMVNNGEILIKFGNDEKQEKDGGYPIISGGMNFMGGGELGLYPNMGDLGRFESEDFSTVPSFLQGNGGISLSLGLPPSNENNHHQHFNNLSGTSHTFVPQSQNIHQFRRGNDFGSLSNPASNAAFECIDIQNRKGFAAQLLPDFVA